MSNDELLCAGIAAVVFTVIIVPPIASWWVRLFFGDEE